MMTTPLQRIEALEAAQHRVALTPLVERIAAEEGLGVDELLAEADRIAAATEGLTEPERERWLARDLAASTTLTEAEALAAIRDDARDILELVTSH